MDFSLCEDNPIENIIWIKELVERQSMINNTLEITQYNYMGNTVFSVDTCPYNCSDSLINVYDCDQNLICEFGGIAGLNTCPDFDVESINQGTIFSNVVKQEETENPIEKIKFQNSFGACLGFCTHFIEIEDQRLVFSSTDRLSELEQITCERDLTDEEWEELQNDIDIDQFLTLDDVFGCPDCADGGASFVEIELANGETKKVTFEFKNPPSIIEEYAEMLQTLLEGANNCEEEEEEPILEKCYRKVIISNDAYNAFSASEILDVTITGNIMNITHYINDGVSFDEMINLIDSSFIAESLPVQRSLKFSYSALSTTLNGMVETTTSFDISELATYNDPEVILNIEGYNEKITFIRQTQCGDPDSTCEVEYTQEQEFKQLQLMLGELKLISSIVTCESSSEIIGAPVGAKVCGGPQLYLPYTSSINVDEFLNKIEIYTNAEKAFNIKWGIASTCDITAVPTYECIGGKPVKVEIRFD